MIAIPTDAIKLSYTMSMKENDRAKESIDVHTEEEKIKGYFPVHAIGMLVVVSLFITIIACALALLNSYQYVTNRLPVYVTVAGFISYFLFNELHKKLKEYYLNKNEDREIKNHENYYNLLICKDYISMGDTDIEIRIFWQYITLVYQKDNFIFIRRKDNRFIVIPTRVFTQPNEITHCISYIEFHMQNKEKVG